MKRGMIGIDSNSIINQLGLLFEGNLSEWETVRKFYLIATKEEGGVKSEKISAYIQKVRQRAQKNLNSSDFLKRSEAYYCLAICAHLDEDHANAEVYYDQAIELSGHPAAMVNCAVLCLYSWDWKKNSDKRDYPTAYKKAMSLFQRAIEENSTDAMVSLAHFCRQGFPSPEQLDFTIESKQVILIYFPALAAALYQLASESGNSFVADCLDHLKRLYPKETAMAQINPKEYVSSALKEGLETFIPNNSKTEISFESDDDLPSLPESDDEREEKEQRAERVGLFFRNLDDRDEPKKNEHAKGFQFS